RSADGHFVRSKAEMLIDNWLYMAEIAHAYERKLPIEETVYSDFYIPAGKVYIEYWGYKNNPKYLARKQTKLSLYEKYGFNLIELNDKDVQNLDDVLPRWLLKYGVQAY
ncbi:MAG: glycerol kinase, partial [Cyanobacteria bacterium J06649_5]